MIIIEFFCKIIRLFFFYIIRFFVWFFTARDCKHCIYGEPLYDTKDPWPEYYCTKGCSQHCTECNPNCAAKFENRNNYKKPHNTNCGKTVYRKDFCRKKMTLNDYFDWIF